jgi:hypothetical protein
VLDARDLPFQMLLRQHGQALLIPVQRRDEAAGRLEPAAVGVVRAYDVGARLDAAATLKPPIRQLRVFDIRSVERFEAGIRVVSQAAKLESRENGRFLVELDVGPRPPIRRNTQWHGVRLQRHPGATREQGDNRAREYMCCSHGN